MQGLVAGIGLNTISKGIGTYLGGPAGAMAAGAATDAIGGTSGMPSWMMAKDPFAAEEENPEMTDLTFPQQAGTDFTFKG